MTRSRHAPGFACAAQSKVAHWYSGVGDAEHLTWFAVEEVGRALVAQLIDRRLHIHALKIVRKVIGEPHDAYAFYRDGASPASHPVGMLADGGCLRTAASPSGDAPACRHSDGRYRRH